MDELAYMLASKEKKTCGNTRRDVEVKPWLKTLAVRLAEVVAKKLRNTLDHVHAKALVNKFLATVAEMKSKTSAGTARFRGQGTCCKNSSKAIRGKSENNADILSYVKRG